MTMSAAKLALVVAATVAAAACAVGPDFKTPPAPTTTHYTRAPEPTGTVAAPGASGVAQTFSSERDIPADWWTLFHSRPLNDLIEQSLRKNPDLKAAQAALTAAWEDVLAQRGGYYPSLSASFSASRQRQSGILAPALSNNVLQYNLFTPEVAVSYVPDVFGLNRRTVESLQAQEQAARFQMIATYTTLTSNVVVTAIQAGAIRSQIDATRQVIDLNSRMLEILRYQLEKGYASGLDVAAQESQLAQAQALLPPLLKQSAQLRDALAALTGVYPSQAPADDFDENGGRC